MKTVLIHHAGDHLNGEGMARWLSSFSEVVGVIEIHEPGGRLWKRIRREWRRSGPLRFIDVLAFRLYYRFRLASKDAAWEAAELDRIRSAHPAPNPIAPVLKVSTPNSKDAEAFLRAAAPDLMIARCKSLLRKGIYSIPRDGTYVMHPGICPDYRNAHGCFWALAQGDVSNVGMTLLRIDDGIDTGPVYGHYRCQFDELHDSHIKIQNKVVMDNYDAIRDRLIAIHEGDASVVDTSGRPSREWGQPWLSAYVRWRRGARRRSRV